MNKLNAGWIGFLKKDEQYWQHLQQLADLGYRALEGGDEIYQEGPEAIARLKDMGLKVLTLSGDVKDLAAGQYQPYLDKAKALGAKQITVWACAVNASFWGEKPEYDKVMKDYETMEKAATFFKEQGIDLCYHNHYQDFVTHFRQVKAFDLMLNQTENLKIELDVGWVLNGLEDPVKLMERIAPRLTSIHIKDWQVGEPREEGGFKPIFTTVGNGELNIKAIMETASKLGLEWAVVEQDELHHLNTMESLTVSYLNLKETGYLN